MITRVMGRKTETWWTCEPHKHIESVAEDGSIKYRFDCKPELKSNVVEFDPIEICQYDGNPQKSNVYKPFGDIGLYTAAEINIGDEKVAVIKETFYADRGEWQQLVDKIVENTDYGKEVAEAEYAEDICEYNQQMIGEDERMKAYCELHHLDPAETDADELRKIVYANITIPSYTISSKNAVYTPITYTPTWSTTTTGTSITGVATTDTIDGWI